MREEIRGEVGKRCWGEGRASGGERCTRNAVVMLREKPAIVGKETVRFTFGFCARCAPFYRSRGYEQVGDEQAPGEQMGLVA